MKLTIESKADDLREAVRNTQEKVDRARLLLDYQELSENTGYFKKTYNFQYNKFMIQKALTEISRELRKVVRMHPIHNRPLYHHSVIDNLVNRFDDNRSYEDAHVSQSFEGRNRQYDETLRRSDIDIKPKNSKRSVPLPQATAYRHVNMLNKPDLLEWIGELRNELNELTMSDRYRTIHQYGPMIELVRQAKIDNRHVRNWSAIRIVNFLASQSGMRGYKFMYPDRFDIEFLDNILQYKEYLPTF